MVLNPSLSPYAFLFILNISLIFFAINNSNGEAKLAEINKALESNGYAAIKLDLTTPMIISVALVILNALVIVALGNQYKFRFCGFLSPFRIYNHDSSMMKN